MDRKNTILLTVIAIATLLVAVVGATFAYFSSQVGKGSNTNVTVETSTTDTTVFQGFHDLAITANQTNFSKEKAGSLQDTTEGSVSFTTSSSTDGGSTVNYCYNVVLEITENDFNYSLPKTFSESKHYPELVLDIWNKTGDDSESVEDWSSETNHYTTSFKVDSSNNELAYNATILENAKICDKNGNTCPEDSNQTIGGYDVTVFGNHTDNYDIQKDYTNCYFNGESAVCKTAGGEQTVEANDPNSLKEVTTINIPIFEKISEAAYDEANYKHKISVTGSGKKYDHWKFALTFVNYADSESFATNPDGSGQQNLNTDKNFKAQIKFVPLSSCD